MTFLGFEEDLSKTYVHLLVAGSARPEALSSALEISRTEAYRRLDRLKEAGMATLVEEKPATFAASAPADILEGLLERHQQRAHALGAIQRRMESTLTELAPYPPSMERRTFRHVQGRGPFHEEARRLIASAQHDVLYVDTHPHCAQFADATGILEFQEKQHGHAPSLTILMADMPDVRAKATGSSLRVVDVEAVLRFVLVDNQMVLFTVTNDATSWVDSPVEQGVVTGGSGFVACYSKLFTALWIDSPGLPD